MSDQPIIAWRNALTNATYNVTAGADDSGAPLSNIWDDDLTRPALPTADGTGTLTFDITLDQAANDTYLGQYPFGYGPYGRRSVDVLIIGAHRHEAAGYHWSGGHIKITAGSTVLLDTDFFAPANSAMLYKLTPHTPAWTYTITISGLTASAVVPIPYLYLGPALTMPYLELGYDPYPEHTSSVDFRAESGRLYRSVRYKQLKSRPRWRYLRDTAVIRHVWDGIEQAFEDHQPVWWAWRPDSLPHECYLMDVRDTPGMPIRVAMMRDLELQLEEVL